MSAILTSCFVLSATDGKIEQCVCIKFCVKLGKSVTKILEMLHEALGEHSLSWTVFLQWHSCFKAGRVSDKDEERSERPCTSKQQKMLKKFKNSSRKTVIEQSTSLRTPARSIMEFASRF
jgi:hypothetical protein